MYERACCHDEAASHPLPTAVASWVIQTASTEECSSLMQNWMQNLFLCLLSHFECDGHTCSLNSIYHPHWLVQWSHPWSRMHIPVHSPWLPGHIDDTQTVRYNNKGWTFPGQTSSQALGWLLLLTSRETTQNEEPCSVPEPIKGAYLSDLLPCAGWLKGH